MQHKWIATKSRCHLKRVPTKKRIGLHLGLFGGRIFTFFRFGIGKVQHDTNVRVGLHFDHNLKHTHERLYRRQPQANHSPPRHQLELFMCSVFHHFCRCVEDITCVYVPSVSGEGCRRHSSGKGANTTIRVPLGVSRANFCCADAVLFVYALVIDHLCDPCG